MTPNLVPGHKPIHEAKFLSLAKRHVRTGPADDGQRVAHVQAIDARQINTAHLEQLRAQVELGRIAGPAALLGFGRSPS